MPAEVCVHGAELLRQVLGALRVLILLNPHTDLKSFVGGETEAL